MEPSSRHMKSRRQGTFMSLTTALMFSSFYWPASGGNLISIF